MIAKKRYRDLRIMSTASQCPHCAKKNEYTLAEEPLDLMGAMCGYCDAILWFHRGGDPYTRKTFDLKLDEAGKVAFEAIKDGFFSSLPPCPDCAKQDWIDFVPDYLRSDPDCRHCGKKIPLAAFRPTTNEKAGEWVNWYAPDSAEENDDDE
jgi:hypothetical protein